MFQTLPPPTELQAYVRFFWTVQAPAGAATTERVVPDGCCELIWQLADPFARVAGTGQSRIQPPAFLFGQLEQSISLAPLGAVDILGVRLTPAGAAGLWRLNAAELQAQEYSLDDLFGTTQQPPLELLRTTPWFSSRRDILVRWLHARLSRTQPSAVRRTLEVLGMMHRGIEQPLDLAKRIGCTRRSLERAFRAATGLSPATYLRLRRIDACLPGLRARNARLATIAADSGFADQAHFSREFRKIVGISPSEYRKEQGVREPLVP